MANVRVIRKTSSLFISLKRANSCRADQLEEDGLTAKGKTLSSVGAVCTLLQTAVGSAILTLPFALSSTGLLLGGALMVFALLVNLHTSVVLAEIGELL